MFAASGLGITRFFEWSTACLEMQLEEITNASYTGPAVHYLGIFLEDDQTVARALESSVCGKLMSDWWDSSTESGPARRPHSSVSEPTPSLEVLSIGDDSKCKNLSSALDSYLVFRSSILVPQKRYISQSYFWMHIPTKNTTIFSGPNCPRVSIFWN